MSEKLRISYIMKWLKAKKNLYSYKLYVAIKYYIQSIAYWARTNGYKGYFKEIESYKDIHKGERCFIICSGPSLTIEDIEKLKNEKTFVMNSFVSAMGDISYTPTYYALQDGRVYHKYRDAVIRHASDFKACFLGNYYVDKICKKDIKWVRFPQYFMGGIDNDYLKEKTPTVKFSSDVSLAVYDGGTIAYSILQIAVYMGFTNIYLIGADCEYKSGEKNEFTNDLSKMTQKELDLNSNGGVTSWITAYGIADEYAKNHGIHIFNATRGGKLEIFPRISLEELGL